jgi:predicted membrane channel-forming protein YqfA (hemolysin III family)
LSAKKAATRGVGFALMAVFRIGVLVVRFLRLGYTLDTSGGFYLWIAAEVGGFVGGLVNVLRIPEKWPNRPPWVDLVGNSHNIMHVCTVISYWIVWFAFWTDAETAVVLQKDPVCG